MPATQNSNSQAATCLVVYLRELSHVDGDDVGRDGRGEADEALAVVIVLPVDLEEALATHGASKSAAEAAGGGARLHLVRLFSRRSAIQANSATAACMSAARSTNPTRAQPRGTTATHRIAHGSRLGHDLLSRFLYTRSLVFSSGSLRPSKPRPGVSAYQRDVDDLAVVSEDLEVRGQLRDVEEVESSLVVSHGPRCCEIGGRQRVCLAPLQPVNIPHT